MARRRSGKKIDFVHWTGISPGASSLSAGTAAQTALPATHEPETLLRIRGNYATWLDLAQNPGTIVEVSAGLIPVPEGTGTTVLWSPFSDADAPWVWYDTVVLGYEEMVLDVIDSPQMTSFRSVIDNKAMRILRNQELQFVVENTTIGTASAINATLGARVLSGT